ncbi:MAG: GHMP kinase N terminal domain protein [Candidatus Xenolissoclinum pacificiensis L6]|uniref:GHMP kinase N terminal domain protein n=1 Tax=Candidatus Xenolissoclinum pacificiensis L6 TaxID=1401685 RepID=W2V124_9RICK|nr:MAG: GHMP kinase N terminal domain protein [Candidatus Xenolissoclinum pacificiensis L6]
MSEIMIKAYAKLNMFLHVLSIDRKKDCCQLETVFMKIPNIYDEIYVADSEKLSLEFDNCVIDNTNNTILKAIRLVEKFAGIKIRMRINIRKKIPLGSGLGGSSADAVALLLLLKERYSLSDIILTNIARLVGYDVLPMMVLQKCRSDQYVYVCNNYIKVYTYSNTHKWYLLIVHANICTNTKEVFDLFKKKNSNYNMSSPVWNNVDFSLLENSITKYAEECFVELRKLKEMLNQIDDCYFLRMTGSGSSFFMAFHTYIMCFKNFVMLRNILPDAFLEIVCV